MSDSIRALLQVVQYGPVIRLVRDKDYGLVGLTHSEDQAWFRLQPLPPEIRVDLKVGTRFWFDIALAEKGFRVTDAWKRPKSMPKLKLVLLEQTVCLKSCPAEGRAGRRPGQLRPGWERRAGGEVLRCWCGGGRTGPSAKARLGDPPPA